MSPYRPNPFFSTTNSFFLPSVGDKVDNAVAQGKALGQDAQAKVQELGGKADLKYQDAKEAVKQTASSAPTGVDLYARLVNMITNSVLFIQIANEIRRFALAGALGCAVTHGALTPVDVVKTRIQLEPEVYNRVGSYRRLCKA